MSSEKNHGVNFEFYVPLSSIVTCVMLMRKRLLIIRGHCMRSRLRLVIDFLHAFVFAQASAVVTVELFRIIASNHG